MCQLPRWLVQRGRQGKALEVLLFLRDTEEDAHEELQEIIDYEASLALGEPRRGERLQSDVLHEQRMQTWMESVFRGAEDDRSGGSFQKLVSSRASGQVCVQW